MKIGLRVDVDTFRGTRRGVSNLLKILAAHQIKASFFFCVGPDNMGRHLLRMLRPVFVKKMLRSKALKLYGPEIILRGTLWPGPKIGEKLRHIIRATAEAGHEVGLHAWDHYAWQTHIDHMDRHAIRQSLTKGMQALTQILGHKPRCSAVAGWKCNELTLLEKNRFNFQYNSDCRGLTIFRPIANGQECTPQIPVTLPTYDEVINRKGITDSSYNDYLLSRVQPENLNVLAIHAEVEGMACAEMFKRFLEQAISRGIAVLPLGDLLPDAGNIAVATIAQAEIEGREGWVCLQSDAVPT